MIVMIDERFDLGKDPGVFQVAFSNAEKPLMRDNLIQGFPFFP
tara:strand:+ start:400 stop:528 length:129 start_codon:yes stop_codon:yes gene_type:complete